MNILREDSCIKIWCTRKLDKIIKKPHKSYCISFPPAGNGKYSKNLNTNFTLQDDFVINVYQSLLIKNKILKKQ